LDISAFFIELFCTFKTTGHLGGFEELQLMQFKRSSFMLFFLLFSIFLSARKKQNKIFENECVIPGQYQAGDPSVSRVEIIYFQIPSIIMTS